MPRHERFGRSAAGSFRATAPVCRRNHLLYHGTLLYDFPLELVERCLAMPPRMPDYREGRPHESFVTNLPLRPETIRKALVDAFGAGESRVSWPERRTAQLVAEKYSLPEWQSAVNQPRFGGLFQIGDFAREPAIRPHSRPP